MRAWLLVLTGLLLAGCGRPGLTGPPGTGDDDDDDNNNTVYATPPPELVPPPVGDGDLTVDTNSTAIPNVCKRVISTAPDRVTVNNINGLTDGDRYVIFQIQASVVSAVGDPAPIQAPNPAGTWEVFVGGDVQDTTGGSQFIEIPAPLENNYESALGGGSPSRAQVCTFPAYNDVTVPVGNGLIGTDWDGNDGGVVAFTVSGTLTLGGAITVDGQGFRGGESSQDTLGQRGEGIDVQWYNDVAPENGGNGGGGGPNNDDGGGGGGNAGAGGYGAHAGIVPGDPRALFGAALDVTGPDLVFFGGGGGSGSDNSQGTSQAGGAGGGVILIGANAIVGQTTAIINVGGADGENGAGQDGGGGGGAGGTIIIYGATSNYVGQITARGGDGADVDDTMGAGGGGGGGRVLGYGEFNVTTANVAGGEYGAEDGNQNPEHEGTDGAPGTIENEAP